MKKMKMTRDNSLTFEQGCELYLNNCRERNLREGTVKHCRQSYDHFYKFFDRDMPVKDICEANYKAYILHLRGYIDNDRSINSYELLRTIILHEAVFPFSVNIVIIASPTAYACTLHPVPPPVVYTSHIDESVVVIE